MTTFMNNNSGVETVLPKFGDILENGGTVIEYRHQYDGGDGCYPYGIVLAHSRHVIGEFVTWRVALTPHGFVCESGDYCRNIVEAAESLERRA